MSRFIFDRTPAIRAIVRNGPCRVVLRIVVVLALAVRLRGLRVGSNNNVRVLINPAVPQLVLIIVRDSVAVVPLAAVL
jgi:hypothetical protein